MIFLRTALLIILALAITSLAPSRVDAQIPIPGQTLVYRAIDTDSHQELQRSRITETTDSEAPVWLTETTFPNGAKQLNECIFKNGYEHPATASHAVLYSASGELERSDFDTFDPAYYPFLSGTVSSEMQPAACMGKGAINLTSIINGGTVGFEIWTDSGFIGLTFHREDTETISVPAGRFDAMRVGVEVDLSRLFPRVPNLFLKLFTPTVKLWMTRSEPYYILKMTGLGGSNGDHPHSIIELVSIDAPSPVHINHENTLPPDPAFALANSGSFVQGEHSGHVTMGSATTPDGLLVDAKVSYTDGMVIENRELIDPRAKPPAKYIEDRTFSRGGALMRRHQLFFRSAAFPYDPEKKFPPDLYGADMTLGMVLPSLLPESSDTTTFHVIDWGGQVSELEIRRDGVTKVATSPGEANGIHCKLKPIVELPILLRPLGYFFIPSFDLDFDATAGHRVLRFEGPFGPPGAAVAHMVADEKPSSAAPASAK